MAVTELGPLTTLTETTGLCVGSLSFSTKLSGGDQLNVSVLFDSCIVLKTLEGSGTHGDLWTSEQDLR